MIVYGNMSPLGKQKTITKETMPLQLNQIARMVLTTAKELFFDPYRANNCLLYTSRCV